MSRLTGPVYTSQIILADHDTTVPLPAPPLEIGQQFLVVDNLGLAGTTNITVTGNIAGNASGTGTISSNYGALKYTWVGSTYVNL